MLPFSFRFLIIIFSIICLSACKDAVNKGNLRSEEESRSQEKASIPSPEIEKFEKVNTTPEVAKPQKETEQVIVESNPVKEKKPQATPKPKPKKKKKKTQAKPIPKVEFKDTHFDFGSLVEGDTTSFQFEFKNVGRVPLNVDRAEASCGCTRPSFPFLPVDPGQSGFIGVQYISIGKQGEQTPEILFYYNKLKTPIVLTMSGFVEPKPEKEDSKDSTTTTINKETIKDSIK